MKKNIYLIIIGVIIFGIGLIILAYEIDNFNINSKVPVKDEKIITYYLDNDYKYKISCNNCDIKYVVDEEMENTFDIKVRYPKEFYSYKIEDNIKGNYKNINIKGGNISSYDVYNVLIRDIKNKNIRNYFNYFKMKVIVFSSSSNLERLGVKNGK